MAARPTPPPRSPRAGLLARLTHLAALAAPGALLLLISLRAPTGDSLIMWVGTAFQFMGVLLALVTRRASGEAPVLLHILLYLSALGWLVVGGAGLDDSVSHLAKAVLLVVPLVLFAQQCLRDSGATVMRRARQLAGRLALRRDWPADLTTCRDLPEVKALREAVHIDASPALELLANPRPAVRVAALAALEYRPSWRAGQPEVVLQLARRAPEPEVRAAAVNALANVEDRCLVESLAELLRDASPLVRRTTTEALLWNSERHWAWARHEVRNALADPACQHDGPLRLPGAPLPAEAVADLHAWAAEKGILALRAALTLGAHYHQVLHEAPDADLVAGLCKQLTDPHTPAMLRLELARLLSQAGELDDEALLKLLSPSMPAPVRLIGVEALLEAGPSPEAVAALHDLARLPNREIALATADVMQRRLGVEMGLPRGGPPPPVQSRQAADVARRVLAWAAQNELAEDADPPEPHARPSGNSSRVHL